MRPLTCEACRLHLQARFSSLSYQLATVSAKLPDEAKRLNEDLRRVMDQLTYCNQRR